MDKLIMNSKEREQNIIFAKLHDNEITRPEAAAKLHISSRWLRKKYKRFLEFGAAGLVHKGRGTVSPRRWPEEYWNMTLALIKDSWAGVSPKLAAEVLWTTRGIAVSKETIRQRMITAKVWTPESKAKKHRSRRERRERFGLLVQLDGSPHDWFENRGPKCTLIVFIDDATGKLLWLEFAESESMNALMQATKNYINAHGRPHEFYVDRGSVFCINQDNPNRDKKTQWERAVNQLKIKVIHAKSPQAKGRVERANKTLQDRLVFFMRLAGVNSIETANHFLRTSSFIEDHNQQFALKATLKGDAHMLIDTYKLDDIFSLQEERTLANDYTVSFGSTLFQFGPVQPTLLRPRDKIIVSTRLDGSIRMSFKDFDLAFHQIARRPQASQKSHTTPLLPSRGSHENSLALLAGHPVVPLKDLGQQAIARE